jgi:putative heme degradation protein
VPQSLDFSQTGEIRTTPDARSGAIEMEIKNKQVRIIALLSRILRFTSHIVLERVVSDLISLQGDVGAIMSGQRNASKDYALIFNGKEFWIEKVSSSANLQMKGAHSLIIYTVPQHEIIESRLNYLFFIIPASPNMTRRSHHFFDMHRGA